MIASAQTIVTSELNSLKERIAANIISSGSNATGKTIQSLSVDVFPEGSTIRGVLYGRPFFGALETGSSAWKNREKFRGHIPKFFAEQIQEWINAKGLDLNAYAVAHNIIQNGTKLHQQGGRDTIYSREIPLTLDRIAKRIADMYQITLQENIKLNTK